MGFIAILLLLIFLPLTWRLLWFVVGLIRIALLAFAVFFVFEMFRYGVWHL